MRIGFTGHQRAPESAFAALAEAVDGIVGSTPRAIGSCSLAAGGDQVFAERMLAGGGVLEVVIPSAGYRATFTEGGDARRFDHLLSKAAMVRQLPFPEPSEEAFLAAGLVIVERCDLLFALWDGRAAAGLGGTGDVVGYAREYGVDVRVIWPQGLARD